MSTNSVVNQKDLAWGGTEWFAFVDAGGVDHVLAMTLCNEYPGEDREITKRFLLHATKSHLKHTWQTRIRVKTSAESNMNTASEVADVSKSLISVSPLLERWHELVPDETRNRRSNARAVMSC